MILRDPYKNKFNPLTLEKAELKGG